MTCSLLVDAQIGTDLTSNLCLLQVNHSQRLNNPSLKPWAVVRRDGVVLGGHCNCTAGQGEFCSHVAAMLFRLWQHNQQKDTETTATCKKCKWDRPSETVMKKVEYLQGKNIVFNSTQKSKKQSKTELPSSDPKTFPLLTPNEQSDLYNSLCQCSTKYGKMIKPTVLGLVREYSDSYMSLKSQP